MDAPFRIDLPSRTCAVAGFLTAAVGSLIIGGLFATWYGFGSVLHLLLVVMVGYLLSMHCTRNGGDLFGMISFFYLPQGDAARAPVERKAAPALEHTTTETVKLKTPEPEKETEPTTAAAEGESRGTAPRLLSKPRGSGADDLKKIKGVGPKLETLLNEMGVYHFDQIAGWSAAELAWVDDNLGSFKGRAGRDDWIAQAKALTAS